MPETLAKKKRGRPPLPKGQVKAKIVPMRLNARDVELFAGAARAAKQTLSEWMRLNLRREAMRLEES